MFDQKGLITIRNESRNYKVGMDYFINKKSTIGVIVNGTISDPSLNNKSNTPISYLLSKTVTSESDGVD